MFCLIFLNVWLAILGILSIQNKRTCEEATVRHKHFGDLTDKLFVAVLEGTETHTDPMTSDLKERGCQERQRTDLRGHELSHQPQTALSLKTIKSHKYAAFLIRFLSLSLSILPK